MPFLVEQCTFSPILSQFMPKTQAESETLAKYFTGSFVQHFFRIPIRWSRDPAERIWGEFSNLVWRNSGKLPTNFSANSDGKFFPRIFRRCCSGVSAPPKKFTAKIHAQNCRHSSPISLSQTQKFLTPIFCSRGWPTIQPPAPTSADFPSDFWMGEVNPC